jgi:hypothetical protein
MLLLNPEIVKFGSVVWTDVTMLAVQRSPACEAVEWSDFGPHVVLADVPEQRVEITVVRRLTREEIASPRPGESGEIAFYTSPAASEAGRKRLRSSAVVLSVEFSMRAQRGGRPEEVMQEIRLVCISSDGAADPLIVEDASGGQV